MREIQSAERRICVSVCAQNAQELGSSVERAARLADIIELRLDCLPGAELDKALSGLDALLSSHAKPFILTLRPAEQGGLREIDALNRIVFWLDRLGPERAKGELLDIELDVARLLMQKEGLDWSRVICSYHDFSGTGSGPENLYQQMKQTPAGVIKIAIRALDATDSIPIFKLLERAKGEGREIIAVAMGEAGIVTRILGPSRGSFLTYGALDKGRATAPGQPTAEELANLYRVHKITESTMVTGLIGGTIAHSISPHIHNAAFAQSDVDGVYVPFEVREVEGFLRRMARPLSREINWELRGLSVTAPHKRAVMQYLDWIEPSAREIGAVNTILVEGEELHGYNTDAVAFLSTLEEKFGHISGKGVAILGAGGAARSALWALMRAGAQVTVFARDEEKGARLGGEFGARAEALEGALFDGFDVVINATPLGTRSVSEGHTPVTLHQLRGARCAYDLVYNPSETRFLSEAIEAGCEVIGGLGMLISQAAEQFRLWTGRHAPVAAMMEAANRALESKAS